MNGIAASGPIRESNYRRCPDRRACRSRLTYRPPRCTRRAAPSAISTRRPTVAEAAGQVLRFALLTPPGRNGGEFPGDKPGWLG